jgi:hypothetical protein
MFKSKYARFMFAPDTGADGGVASGVTGDTVANTTTTAKEVDTTDYKALYEKQKTDYDKLKRSFDTTASEVAELKKANKAKLSEEEQQKLEQAEREQLYRDTLNQLNAMKVDTVFAKQGYDEKDYTDLSKKIVEVGGDKANELAEIVVEFVKKANKTAIANAKNSMIKDSAITPKASTETQPQKGEFARFAREQSKKQLTAEDIQKYYHK